MSKSSQSQGRDNRLQSSKRAKKQALHRAMIETLETRQMLTATVGIEATDAVATEAVGNTGTFRLTRDDTTGSLTVDLEFSGIAENGTDYKTVNDSVTFAAGKATVDVTITPIQDSKFEGTEDVTIAIADSDDYDTDMDAASDTVNITDDEKPTVSISADDDEATEGDDDDTATFTLTRDSTEGTLAVKLTIAGTATNGTDYNTVATTVNIPDGEDHVDVEVTTKGDSALEGTEKILLTLAAGTGYNISSSDKTTTLLIADDEVSTVSIKASDATATEGGSDVGKFTITRTGTGTAIADALVVNFDVSGTATDGTDFTSLGDSVTIPAGKATVDVTVTTKNDSSVEGAETAIVTLAEDDAYSLDEDKDTATVTINDDDKPTVGIAGTDKTASETGANNTGKFTISRNGATTAALTVPIVITGTATNGTDYKTIATTVTIPAGASSKVIEVKPKDDTTFEGSETVIVTLGTGATFLADGAAKTATVTISEDELPDVSIVATDASAAEPGSDKGLFTFTRTGTGNAIAGALVVNFDVDGTATDGTDDTSLGTSVTIPAGKNSVTLAVAAKDDSSLEGSETVVVTLADDEAYDGDPDASDATVTIKDDEKATVSIDATDATGSEASSATGEFTISRSGPTTDELKVTYTIAGTATNGTDYTKIVNSVTIPAGESDATVTITPTDDALLEGSETVILTLAAGVGYTPSTDAKTDTVTIADNEKSIVSVKATDAIASETKGNTATLTFTRTGAGTAIAGALDVLYAIDDDSTATSEDDYAELTGTATIPAGKSSITVTVTPVDDSDLEGTENVIVNLSTSSNYTRDTDNKVATVTVQDNEVPTVGVDATTASVSEDDAAHPGVFTFTRTGPTTDALDVLYTVTGTATGTKDFTEVLTGKVTIAAGHASKTLSITPIDDSNFEGDETVIVTMKAAATYTIDSGAKTDTVTVSEDDLPTVSIVGTDLAGKEGGKDGVVLTISRTGVTTTALSVDLTTSGTTAGADFTAALPTSVTIPAGKAFTTVTIQAKDDGTYEGTELLTAALGESDDYAIDEDNGGVVATITDAQLPTISIDATDSSASEVSNATGKFTISRADGQADTDAITFSVTFGGVAKNAKDFNKITKTYTIPAGQDTRVITITPKTDTAVEGPETVVLALAKGNYTIDSGGASDTVTIADEQVPTVSVAALDTPVLETDSVGARFRLWRTGANATQAVTISFALGGDATTDDFTITDEDGNEIDVSDTDNVSVTIPIGRSFMDIYIIPVNDGDMGTDDKDVSLTINDDSSYIVDDVLGTDSITITGV